MPSETAPKGHVRTREHTLGGEGPVEMLRGGRGKTAKAREETPNVLPEKKCVCDWMRGGSVLPRKKV